MRFQVKHAEFAAKLTFFFVTIGLALIAFAAEGVDFRGYYGAAVVVVRGGNPYDYSQLAPVLQEITGFAGNNPYFYPPWFSLLFVPFTLLPFQAARLVWLLLNVGLFYGGLRLLQEALGWEIGGWKRWAVYLAATLTFAAYCLRSEQAGILLLFFLALTLVAIKRERHVVAGLALLLLASKPQATILAVAVIAIWLLRRQRRTLLWAAIGTVALTALSSLAIPNWWRFDRTGFGAGLAYELDGPDQIAAQRVLSTVYDFSEYVLQLGPPLQAVLALCAALFGLALLVAAWRRFDNLILPLSAALILTFLVTPYALQYDYVVLALPFMWTLMRLARVEGVWRWLALSLILANLSVLLWQQWSYQGYLQLLAIAGAFAITLFASGAVREPSSAQGSHKLAIKEL